MTGSSQIKNATPFVMVFSTGGFMGSYPKPLRGSEDISEVRRWF